MGTDAGNAEISDEPGSALRRSGARCLFLQRGNSMRKWMAVLMAMMITFLTTGAGCAETSEAETPLFQLSSIEMTRRMGNGTNLGNTMEACDNRMAYLEMNYPVSHYETLWGQPVTTREMIHGLKAAGFDSLRIPVAWMSNATRLYAGDYTIREEYLARVEELVSWAVEEDMIVIVNDHWDGGWYGMFGSEKEETRTLAMEAYKGMWAQIAARFSGVDGHLIFEGANEEIGARFDENSTVFCMDSTDHFLSDAEKYSLANEVNQAFVDTVRAAGGYNAERFLLIPGFGTNIAQTCDPRFVMPKDSATDRLLISVHCYSPWSYCGASSARSATPWGLAAHFDELEQELKMMTKFTAQGIGVVIGEYGALPGSDGVMKDNSVTYHRFFLDLCDYYDYCPMLWDTSGFYVRRELAFRDQEMGGLYASRRRALEEKDTEKRKAAAAASMEAARTAAPASFRTDAPELTEDTAIAWIMWNSSDWSLSYSVGDTYQPDSLSPGVVPTDAVITGPGTYTVGLDFRNSERGGSSNVGFGALGIANGEILYPGYCIFIRQVKINGEAVKLKGRNYTCSDDGKCTRSNLYNEWVDMSKVGKANARVMIGDLTGISATLLDREAEEMKRIETLEITFEYGPKR